MVEPAHHRLSISAQCRLLRISRSSYYYAPVPEADETLALMTVIDTTFLDCPWYGSRQMARHLRRNGRDVGRRRPLCIIRTQIHGRPCRSFASSIGSLSQPRQVAPLRYPTNRAAPFNAADRGTIISASNSMRDQTTGCG